MNANVEESLGKDDGPTPIDLYACYLSRNRV